MGEGEREEKDERRNRGIERERGRKCMRRGEN